MTCCTKTDRMEQVTLWGETAADLMTPNPASIRSTETIDDAIALLTDGGFGAAPVIDDSGRPIGVLSHSDIMVHDRETPSRPPAMRRLMAAQEVAMHTSEVLEDRLLIEEKDGIRVGDIMTPAAFSVMPNTPVRRIVADMVSLKVHQIYVVDNEGLLVGVISALDVLRHLVATDPQPVAPS
jgi:CBS domain-containing protein